MTFRLQPNTTLRAELDIKRSRFIAIIRRCATVTEARNLIYAVRNEFPDARHHCSAFVVSGQDSPEDHSNPVLNSSDDGEPSGTAGRPMLDVLLGNELMDVCAVVVRYFGGTLLGTGGLVRAYSDAVRAALSDAPVNVQIQRARAQILLPHTMAGKVEAELRGRGTEVLDVAYRADGAELDVAVTDPFAFRALVAELTNGTVEPVESGVVITEKRGGTLPEFKPRADMI